VEACTEPKAVDDAPAGLVVGKKRRGTARTASAMKNPRKAKPMKRLVVRFVRQARPRPAKVLQRLSSAFCKAPVDAQLRSQME